MLHRFFLFAFLFGSTLLAPAVTFRDFSGVCQGGDSSLKLPYWDTLAGWNRIDIAWNAAEPVEGQYNEAYLKKVYSSIRKNLDRGVKMLPMLGYAPGWASRDGEYVFTCGDSRKFYNKLGGNEYRLREFKKEKNGGWVPRTDKAGNPIDKTVRNPRIPLAPENIAKWQAFIRRVVSDLRAEPYRLEYFQIWNEAHPKSGFYDGEMQEYLKNIHLPAAEAIRDLGGKVVYGGYPCCGAVDALARDLTKAKAWNSLDVIDIHYFPEWCMDYLRRKAAENGNPGIGVWQTEIVFHRNYYAVAQIYPNVLYRGLTHNWKNIDRYKLFFFAFGSPDDPKAYGYGKCLLAGTTLTPHGKALETLADIFGSEELAAYDRIVSIPKLDFANKGDRISGFRFGNKILVAVNFDAKTRENQEKEGLEVLKLTFPGLKTEQVNSAVRIGVFGERRDLAVQTLPDGVTLEVPLAEEESNRYSDKFLNEKSLRRPAFYTLLELK